MATETLRSVIPSKSELEKRWEMLRSHKRATASVRFVAEWEKDRSKLRANGITVDVSHSGCMAILGADLPLHQRVRLIEPVTGRSAEGEVVWRGHEGWDVGIELTPPDGSFWGVKL